MRVLFLDNLSCLFSGIAENDNDAWEAVLPWLLHLRKLNIAVVIVAHAGRNGQMRGASRREDSAAWTLRLDDAIDAATVKRGAKFVSTFTKPSRHTPTETPAYEWEFSPDASGRCEVVFRKASGLEVFLQWLRDGLDACKDIAEAMGVSKGTVSKLAKRAEAAGRIHNNGQNTASPMETRGPENDAPFPLLRARLFPSRFHPVSRFPPYVRKRETKGRTPPPQGSLLNQRHLTHAPKERRTPLHEPKKRFSSFNC